MKTQIALAFGTAAAALVMTSSAFAAGQITFTGEIVSPSCNLTIDDKADATVNLGKWPTSMFANKGDKSTPENFSIKLSGCAAGTYQVDFAGTQDSQNKNLLKLNTGANAASGVGVAIAPSAAQSSLVALNSSATQNLKNQQMTLASGETAAELPMVAYYQANGDTVKAGLAESTVSVTLQLK